jgi:hypothetical protein
MQVDEVEVMVLHKYFGEYISEIQYNSCKVKVKIKLSLCLTKHHAIKTYWESGSTASHILDLNTRWR